MGVKVDHHEPGAALLRCDGYLLAVSEERLNRIKHAEEMFPHLAIEYVLQHSGLSRQDIDLVVVDRVALSDVDRIFVNNVPPVLGKKPIISVNHHESHAASAAYCSGFDEALVMVIDGSGEGFSRTKSIFSSETMSVFEFRAGNLTRLSTTLHDRNSANGHFFVSTGIGKLYTRLTRYVGFGAYEEGKTMGLAPYGGNGRTNPSVLADFKKQDWVRVKEGKIYCNLLFFPATSSVWSWAKSRLQYFYQWVRGRFYQSHCGEESFSTPIYLSKPRRASTTPLPDDYYTSVAFFAQTILEDAILEVATYYRKKTGLKNICTVGGVALNIDANSKLLTEAGFEKIFTQPASSDAGIPLGNVLLAYHQEHPYRPERFRMEHAYLGRSYAEPEILAALKNSDLRYERWESIEEITASLLAENKIIGWFQGGAEYGPRALGNRSILMSPLCAENKDILNSRVKKREMFRPFAPVVCLEDASVYFDMPATESKFMLLVAIVKEKFRKVIPAVTHVDGTARVQTIRAEDNPILYRLLKQFGKKTGAPVLLNTSFNVAGEPIVETPEHAILSFKKCDLDYLILGNYLCKK